MLKARCVRANGPAPLPARSQAAIIGKSRRGSLTPSSALARKAALDPAAAGEHHDITEVLLTSARKKGREKLPRESGGQMATIFSAATPKSDSHTNSERLARVG